MNGSCLSTAAAASIDYGAVSISRRQQHQLIMVPSAYLAGNGTILPIGNNNIVELTFDVYLDHYPQPSAFAPHVVSLFFLLRPSAHKPASSLQCAAQNIRALMCPVRRHLA
jgi:hypothetical protein